MAGSQTHRGPWVCLLGTACIVGCVVDQGGFYQDVPGGFMIMSHFVWSAEEMLCVAGQECGFYSIIAVQDQLIQPRSRRP